MMGWLIGIFGAKDAKRVAIGGGVILAVFVIILGWLIWLHFHDQAVRKQVNAATVTKAREADAKAADSRITTTQVIANDTQELKNAVAPLPDQPLTDRQRARYCATVLRQQGQSASPPAICRSGAKPGASGSGGR